MFQLGLSHLAFADLGVGQPLNHRHAVRGTDQVLLEPPVKSGLEGALSVPVFPPSSERFTACREIAKGTRVASTNLGNSCRAAVSRAKRAKTVIAAEISDLLRTSEGSGKGKTSCAPCSRWPSGVSPCLRWPTKWTRACLPYARSQVRMAQRVTAAR